MSAELEFYASQSAMSEPGDRARLLDGLPHDLSALCRVVQGLMLHVFWTERYGVRPEAERQAELQLRRLSAKLPRILALDPRPLCEPRPPERRLLGNCRDFTLLLTSMLRRQGRPARARCGFARYFQPEHHEDHWVCEYWDPAPARGTAPGSAGRWKLADAQLDELQCARLGIGFDPLEVPRDQFLAGGEAWHRCRRELADPDSFGVGDLHGAWMVRGDLVRDLAALNRVELLPWDAWGLIEKRSEDLSDSDLELLDEAGELTRGEIDFEAVRGFYGREEKLRVPPVIRSYGREGAQEVRLEE